MVNFMEKMDVIRLKNEGKSNREVARQTGLHRETVSKYWEQYKRQKHELLEQSTFAASSASPSSRQNVRQHGCDERAIQEQLMSTPKYTVGGRIRRKYTPEIEARLKELLQLERRKDSQLGVGHKQQMTNYQMFEILREEGHDIGYSTINNALSRLRRSDKPKQVYIRRHYDYGDRVEYDFGEVRLIIGGVQGTYHMAVFASPAGKFRWCKLYTNQKKPVFMDSHVKFFEWLGGVHREVVYDNMKNVVTKFIGKNERQLNEDLLKMSAYYGYKINVTNCFSGNEKGTVEKAVDVLRTELFAVNYRFNTLDDVEEYVKSKLLKLNENALLTEEKAELLPKMPPLELADITTAKVDKTALINVDSAKYSVPETLVGQSVTVKKYHDEVRVYSNNAEVCRHRRVMGKDQLCIDIMHYLDTFLRKPGALSDSVALKSIPKLKAIFDTHYAKKPRQFIEILIAMKSYDIDEIVSILQAEVANKAEFSAISVSKPVGQVDLRSRSAVANYSILVRGGVSA
jgi:transposase